MHPLFVRVLLLALLAASFAPIAPAATNTASSTEPFTFIAIGCMPYGRLPGHAKAYERVLAEINRQSPAFAVHLGDILGSEELATDELFERRRREFDSVSPALIFTPGDNEWTDVHRTGKFQPLERLARIRELFFAREASRGTDPIPLVTQRRNPAFAKFAENARWTHHKVVFATVHVVGSNNNNQPNVAGAVEEWKERDLAVAAWIKETMAEARSVAAPGVVFFCQASPFTGNPGFDLFLDTLTSEARAFGKPVLLVHADEHRFRLEPGMRARPGTPPVPNLTRLETFGASDFHGAIVAVDPASAAVFLAGPWLVPGNPAPHLPRPVPVPAASPTP